MPCLVFGILAKTGGIFYGPKEVTMKILHGPEKALEDGNIKGIPSGFLG
jgi:hypothetical protein